MLTKDPDVRGTVACARENVITVGCPTAATIVWRLVPARQEAVQGASVRPCFPNFGYVGHRIKRCEPNASFIWRNGDIGRQRRRGQQLSWRRSVVFGYEYVVTLTEHQLSARSPNWIVSDQ